MPHHKSTKKSMKTDAVKRMANRGVKSRCRTLEKKFRAAVEEGDKANAEGVCVTVQKALDQAAGHGVLKKETVARKKSRMMKVLNQLNV
jgi:small subunit ribosomal protein S20